MKTDPMLSVFLVFGALIIYTALKTLLHRLVEDWTLKEDSRILGSVNISESYSDGVSAMDCLTELVPPSDLRFINNPELPSEVDSEQRLKAYKRAVYLYMNVLPQAYINIRKLFGFFIGITRDVPGHLDIFRPLPLNPTVARMRFSYAWDNVGLQDVLTIVLIAPKKYALRASELFSGQPYIFIFLPV